MVCHSVEKRLTIRYACSYAWKACSLAIKQRIADGINDCNQPGEKLIISPIYPNRSYGAGRSQDRNSPKPFDKFRGRRNFFGMGILIELTPLHS